jgi:hypothetical protein
LVLPRRISAWVAAAVLVPVLRLPAAEPDFRPWPEYQVILWTGDSAAKNPAKWPLFFQRLREMNVTAGMVHGDGDLRPLLEAKFPYYVENMVNRGLCLKWNSKVRDWDQMVTSWKNPRDEAGLVRDYSLDDPQWRDWALSQVRSLVKKNAPHAPLLYNLRDELSTTISANPFDYDFSPTALAGFRTWLQTQYRSLAALNAQWETAFKTWDEVKPFTTDQIKNRMASGDAIPRGKPDWQAVQRIQLDPAAARKQPTAWNFSPWADHRSYMDHSLATTLDTLRQAARDLDPRTPVGIEGTQMPAAFGGYDLWRLSQAIDWVEPYDIGNAREIFGSFMPGRIFLSTVGEQDARAARRRLWHLLLEGDRGCIVWWSEDCLDWTSADYALTPRAKALAPVFAELRAPLARLFLLAKREVDPVAIHYSQASVQVNWLLESTVDGSTWLRRFSSYEASHNWMTQRRQAWVKLLQDAGYTPRFLSTAQIEQGALENQRVLVCADSLAMTDTEAAAISKWISPAGRQPASRLLLGSDEPNLFDGHGRLRPVGHLAALGDRTLQRDSTWHLRQSAGKLAFHETAADLRDSLARRIGQQATAATLEDQLADQLHDLLPPAVAIPRHLGVRTHRYRLGNARLLAFERNFVWQMGEDLKSHGGNGPLEKPVTFEARLAAPAHAYDLRTEKYLGHGDRFRLTVNPDSPTLLALTATPLAAGPVIPQLAR